MGTLRFKSCVDEGADFLKCKNDDYLVSARFIVKVRSDLQVEPDFDNSCKGGIILSDLLSSSFVRVQFTVYRAEHAKHGIRCALCATC